MYIRTNVSPRTEHSGTPDVTASVVDLTFSTTTHWFQLSRNLFSIYDSRVDIWEIFEVIH